MHASRLFLSLSLSLSSPHSSPFCIAKRAALLALIFILLNMQIPHTLTTVYHLHGWDNSRREDRFNRTHLEQDTLHKCIYIPSPVFKLFWIRFQLEFCIFRIHWIQCFIRVISPIIQFRPSNILASSSNLYTNAFLTNFQKFYYYELIDNSLVSVLIYRVLQLFFAIILRFKNHEKSGKGFRLSLFVRFELRNEWTRESIFDERKRVVLFANGYRRSFVPWFICDARVRKCASTRLNFV